MILKSKNKFHQQKSPISIKKIDINKLVGSNKVFFGKKGFEYFIAYKGDKKLDLKEETLMKLNIYLF